LALPKGTDMNLDPKLVVAAFDQAVDSGDVAALDAICDPNMVSHSFGPAAPQGLDGMRRFVANRRATGAIGAWEEVVTVVQGDYVVQFGMRWFEWPGGPFRGFDVPSGRFVRDCAFLFRLRDGLITDRWAIRDDLTMLAQLGAVTAARPEEVMHGTVSAQRVHPFD
jgi:ketosteroid isomerase-like protein